MARESSSVHTLLRHLQFRWSHLKNEIFCISTVTEKLPFLLVLGFWISWKVSECRGHLCDLQDPGMNVGEQGAPPVCEAFARREGIKYCRNKNGET